jgi:diadenosine tetraphosphatase ApaH/serine/threonine PP2A family protein phosphatase
MLIALFADIHGNLEALNACIAHAKERDARRFVFLGDLVGYGADAAAVVDLVAGFAADGAIVVKGNHDEAVKGRGSDLDDSAHEAIEWTRTTLNEKQREFLASLPLRIISDEMCFVHSSADRPESWRYIDTVAAARESMDAAPATYVFCGHTHEQRLYFRTLAGKTASFHPTPGSAVPIHSHHKWLGVVGSVGQPRDGNPSAAYAIFDTEAEEMTFFRVPYDHLAAAAKIRRAGLPTAFAERIEHGM